MQKPIDPNFDYSKVTGSTYLHNKFKKEFMIYVPKVFPQLVVVPYDVGVARAFSQADKIVRFGQAGVPDILVFGNGWYRMFDTKTGSNRLQKNQKAFQTIIREANEGLDRVHKINSINEGLNILRREISCV